MIKTLADIIKSNKYEFHHAAWHSGYVSRKLNDLDCKVEKYSGRLVMDTLLIFRPGKAHNIAFDNTGF